MRPCYEKSGTVSSMLLKIVKINGIGILRKRANV